MAQNNYTDTMMRWMFATAVALLMGARFVPAQGGLESWLDRPLANWNDARGVATPAVTSGESLRDLAKRCAVSDHRSSPAWRALANAGWLPYLHVDREIVQGDVEIVAGMAAADAMCRPASFNVFVFVGGVAAGTLSPVPMTSRADGAIGAVRLAPNEMISAEFARYQDRDALCCPSSRVSVRYRIDRSGSRPVVVPASVHNLR